MDDKAAWYGPGQVVGVCDGSGVGCGVFGSQMAGSDGTAGGSREWRLAGARGAPTQELTGRRKLTPVLAAALVVLLLCLLLLLLIEGVGCCCSAARRLQTLLLILQLLATLKNLLLLLFLLLVA